MSRPQATLAETRAVARAVAALGSQVAQLTIAIQQIRGGQPQFGRVDDVCRVLDTTRSRIAPGRAPLLAAVDNRTQRRSSPVHRTRPPTRKLATRTRLP
jgi:uncharacterized protein (UPF0218 family)